LTAFGEAFVPILWRYEVSAVLAKAQKDGIITTAKVDAFLKVLGCFNITVDQEGVDRILTDVHRLAVTYWLRSYDAAYLELTIRRKLPLASLDAELIQACKSCGAVVF
jgi:predicted nucleic acid-binding protein